MSGGFFRGTSAAQDTRFSNKQAKLLKSQKFAPELEHQVDITKVKMEVMRPWIAHRVTELLGFEDEVLINFIYGLLDGQKVNGKEVQITLTGFMEKNTGKFMKELWLLLLSAQKNASGVPQQFLDAKEEETRKKMVETQRIANEIQKKKDKEARELEQEKMMKTGGEVGMLTANNGALEPTSKHHPGDANSRSSDEKDTNEKNSSRGRSRVSKSPNSADHSPSPPRGTHSRSISKSFSNSRSHSDERHRSRSRSGSEPRGRSISSERLFRSSLRRPVTPRRKNSPRRSVSPSRRRPFNFRRRSISRSHRRSPSPVRRRLHSPPRRRSRSPMWRSPVRRRSRSPVWHRSQSPIRNRPRSPIKRRSRTPVRQRSITPVRYRTQALVRRLSPTPLRHRSPSPTRQHYRRSPSTPRHRFPHRRRSPVIRRRSPTPRYRSPTPKEWSSPSPMRHMSPSPIRRRSPKLQKRSPLQSARERIRTEEKRSPVCRAFPRETGKGSDSLEHRPPVSSSSLQRDPRNQIDFRRKVPPLSSSESKSPSVSEFPTPARKRSAIEDGRSSSPCETPVQERRAKMTRGGTLSPPPKTREHKHHHDSREKGVEEEETFYARKDRDQKLRSSGKRTAYSSVADELEYKLERACSKDEHSPERVAIRRAGETRSCLDGKEFKKQGQETKSKKNSGRVLHSEILVEKESPTMYKGPPKSVREQESYPREGYKADQKNHSQSNDKKSSNQRQESIYVPNLPKKVEENYQRGSVDSGSKGSGRRKAKVKNKRKHKRSERQETASDDDYSSDSQIDERKEAKRRRMEEKKLRKEERHRRREERRRRREERRAQKQKLKSVDTVTPPSDIENHHHDASDGEHVARRKSHSSDVEEAETEQKRLEIELREKALETLRAKKGVAD